MDKDNGLLGLLGLARKAGKLALGEEDAAAAALGHKTKLLLVASDAAAGTAQRASRAAEAGNAQCFSVALTKAELGGAVGRASCAVLAFTDTGLAAAALKKLSQADPDTFSAAAEHLGAKAAKTVRRRKEKQKRQGALKRAKPWAPPPPGPSREGKP